VQCRWGNQVSDAILAISYSTLDLDKIAPTVEMLLMQLADAHRERVFFFPYADASKENTPVATPAHLEEIYVNADLVVVFYSNQWQADPTPALKDERAFVEKRLKAKKITLFLAIDHIQPSNIPNAPPLVACESLSKPQIATKILVALKQHKAVMLNPRSCVDMRVGWAPGLSEPCETDLAEPVRDLLSASTVVSCQTAWWAQFLETIDGVEHETTLVNELPESADPCPEAHLRTLSLACRRLYEISGGLGISRHRTAAPSSPLGFANSLAARRLEITPDHKKWRAVARLEMLLIDNENTTSHSPESIAAVLDQMLSWTTAKTLIHDWKSKHDDFRQNLGTFARFLQDLRRATLLNLKSINSEFAFIPKSTTGEAACIMAFLLPREPKLANYAIWT
jgi:hypothetical protein